MPFQVCSVHKNGKKLLDNFRRYPYHSTEAIIYLQSVQIKRQKNLAYLASHV
jgi:hypothetical protein